MTFLNNFVCIFLCRFSTHDEDVIYRIWDEESTPYGTNYLENFVYEDGKNPRDIPCAELYDWCDELKLASDDVSVV